MPWAICEWCQRVIGVMWDYKDDLVECSKCGAWLSIERNEDEASQGTN